ncbi:MAG: DUF4430 domain-containing protein [Clostridiaceae bacterium]|nr:DUF4430 domain-containing protein [Clostridiaceae bacterium]
MNLFHRSTRFAPRPRSAVPATLLAVLLAVSLPLLPALGSLVAALPETVAVSLLDTDESVLASADLELATLSFSLHPYVPDAVTDLSDPTPSALHALIALLEDSGRDATDPAVLSAVDSSFGVYVDSILGSTAPMYWTFRVDGADSWVGVFDHKLTAGETIAFVMTEYIPEPTPVPGFVHPVSGLSPQPVDIEGALGVIAAAFAGTSSDWQVLDMARYGLADQVGRDAWLSAAYERLTARRVTPTDLELIALILTGLGIDARSVVVDGMSTNLLARIASTAGLDTYGYIFGLAAFDSAGYPDVTGAANTRASMVPGLLAARLPDGGWSWAPTEAISDTDTTAMAISVLARYAADNADVAAALSAALELLASWQASDGTMGSSNATAMMLIALAATGMDGESDPRFAAADGNLLDGLFRYRTTDGRFGYKSTEYDAFATEQAFRALIVYRELLAAGGAQSPYVFAETPADLETGVVLPGGEPVADTGEAEIWHNAIGVTLLSSALAAVLTLPKRHRRTEEE